MRDGNHALNLRMLEMLLILFSLPMRDGNQTYAPLSPPNLALLFSLPMRDGNLLVLFHMGPYRVFLAYL